MHPVMRGLDTRIHVLLVAKKNVDGRDKPGHDENGGEHRVPYSAAC
jgi:hypothetical protein